MLPLYLSFPLCHSAVRKGASRFLPQSPKICFEIFQQNALSLGIGWEAGTASGGVQGWSPSHHPLGSESRCCRNRFSALGTVCTEKWPAGTRSVDPAVQPFPFFICRVGEAPLDLLRTRTELGACSKGNKHLWRLPLAAFEGSSQSGN